MTISRGYASDNALRHLFASGYRLAAADRLVLRVVALIMTGTDFAFHLETNQTASLSRYRPHRICWKGIAKHVSSAIRFGRDRPHRSHGYSRDPLNLEAPRLVGGIVRDSDPRQTARGFVTILIHHLLIS